MTETKRSSIRHALRLRAPLSWAAVAIASLGFLTNVLHPFIGDVAGGAASHPMTVVCMICLAAFAITAHRFGTQSMWHFAISALIVMVCSARIMEHFMFMWTGAPPQASFGPIFGLRGQFSVESALVLGTLTTAMVLRQIHGRLGMWFLVVGLAVLYTALVGLTYGAVPFSGHMGLFTLFGLLCLGGATATLYVHRPVLRNAFISNNLGRQTRTIAAAVIAIPWVSGLMLTMLNGTSGAVEAGVMSFVTWGLFMVLAFTVVRFAAASEEPAAALRQSHGASSQLPRFQMSEALEAAWLEFRTRGTPCGVLMLDLKQFYRLDDTFGEGDTKGVLTRIEQTLTHQLRGDDVFSHWDSEEILILLRIPDHRVIEPIATRMKRSFQDPNGYFCKDFIDAPDDFEVLVGVSDLREHDHGAADALMRADENLFKARQAAFAGLPIYYDLQAA